MLVSPLPTRPAVRGLTLQTVRGRELCWGAGREAARSQCPVHIILMLVQDALLADEPLVRLYLIQPTTFGWRFARARV
jgi:hypothetical protein